MHFDGEFRVPGHPDDVLTRFADVPRMAQCMPGAAIDGRDEAGVYLGSMVVDFGPKQIRFTGKVEATTDPKSRTGTLRVRGAAQVKTPARAEVRVAYALRPDPEAGDKGTIVSLSSDAQMTGVLAGFAQTGGVVVTRALMDEFAARAAREFARDEPEVAPTAQASVPQARAPQALSAWRLLWQVLKAKLAGLVRHSR